MRGLSFLPVDGPEASASWFTVFANEPLGRGIDHVLSTGSPDWRDQHGKERKRYWRRYAEGRLAARDIAPKALAAAGIVRDVFEFCRSDTCCGIVFPVRFAKEFIPASADFAYFGWSVNEDVVHPLHGRRRAIYCSQRARDILVQAELLTPRQFETREIVATAVAATAPLDLIVNKPLPPPSFLPSEFETARSLAQHDRTRESAVPDLSEALAALSRLVTGTPLLAKWGLTMASRNLGSESRYAQHLPESWKQALSVLPSSFPAGVFDQRAPLDPTVTRFLPFDLVRPESNTWLMRSEEIDDPELRPSHNDIVVARTPGGDWYSFRLGDPALPRDARITLWDHETMQPHFQWPSVAAFVHELTEAIASKLKQDS